MADSKTLKISFGGTIKVAEMLSLAPDHHQTKNMCKHAVKEFSFSIRSVPDRYKT